MLGPDGTDAEIPSFSNDGYTKIGDSKIPPTPRLYYYVIAHIRFRPHNYNGSISA